MKRIISICAACAIMLNLLCISASADGTDSAVFSDARRLLSVLEIGDIQEDYNEALNTAVSRGEAVDAVMRCVIGGGITVSEAPYSDVSPGASYAPAVASAKAMGILSPGGSFRPDDTVTFEELSKIAVSAAGYAPEAEKNGGYPIGYTGTAVRLGLLKGAGTQSGEINSADFAVIISNLLKCSPMVQKNYGTFSRCEILDDTDFLREVFDLEKIRGTVVKTQITSTDSGKYCHDGYAEIEASGRENMLIDCRDTDMSEFLGRSVDIYYKTADDGYELVNISARYGDRDLTVIYADEVDSFRGRVLKYTKHSTDGLWDERTESGSIEIPLDCSILLNGVFTEDISRAFEILNGDVLNLDSVRAVDSDMDGDIDIIDICAYYTVFVKNVDKTNKTISDKYDCGTIDLDEKNVANTVTNGDSMRASEFSSISANTVAAVYMGENTEKKVYKFVTGSKSVSGTVSELSNNSDGVEVKVNGEVYKVSDTIKNIASEIEVGEKYRLYLDYKGKVGGFKADALSNGFDEYGLTQNPTVAGKYFGIVVEGGKSPGVDEKISLKIFSSDGTMKVFEVSSKCTVDKQDYNGSTFDSLTAGIQKKLVQYELNDNSEIVKITSPAKERKDNTLSYSTGFNGTPVTLTFKQSANVFFGNASTAAGSQTVIMNVPDADYTGEVERAYSIGSSGAFTNDRKYTVIAYYTGTDSVAADILLNYSSSSTGSLPLDSEFMVVERVVSTIDEDGTEVKQIDGLQMGYAKSYKTVDSSIVDADGFSVDVSEGDIIQVSTDASGRCKFVRRLYDYDKPESYSPPGSYMDAGRIMKGCVYDFDSNIVQIVKNTFAVDESALTRSDATEFHNKYYARVCLFEKGKKPGSKPTVTKVDSTAFVSYKNDRANYSHVVVASNYGNPGAVIVIYKD